MEKSVRLVVFALIGVYVISLIAQGVFADDVPDPNVAIGNTVGINPDKIPSNPDDLNNQYLQGEWARIISNSTYFGPVHNYLTKHQTIFMALLGSPYTFSLGFFILLVVWILFTTKVGDIINVSKVFPSGVGIMLGFTLSVILSHTGVFSTLINFAMGIISKEENVWIRTILWVLFLSFVFVAYYLGAYVQQVIKNETKKRGESEIE